MTRRPNILIINDDGIDALGLRHLWLALRDHAELTIVAPAEEQSGMGVAVTLRQPLLIDKVDWEESALAWKINGTPADCVRLALSIVLPQAPDLIVSGINRGANSGRNVLSSGTIGGVIEGALRHLPGIAFSCADFDNPDYAICEKYIASIVHYLLEHPLPSGTFLNVNFPEKRHPLRGVKLARQGRGYWKEDPDERIHPEGTPYYWMGGRWEGHQEEEESDVALLSQGYIAAVPIHIGELTDHSILKERKKTFETRLEPLTFS